jgi:hypothetical protein
MSSYAFVIGPDTKEAASLRGVIDAALQQLKIESRTWKAGDAPGAVTVDLVERIRDAALILADIRAANPNVYYEVGLAHALGRPVITFVAEGETPQFDLQGDRAIVVATTDGIVDYQDALGESIKASIRSAERTEPATAVKFAELRAEVPRLRAELDSLRRQSSVSGPTAEAPASGPSWRDLALAGQLPLLVADHLAHDTLVVHLRFGVGRVVGWGPPARAHTTVEIAFEEGSAAFVLPARQLFLADAPALMARPQPADGQD